MEAEASGTAEDRGQVMGVMACDREGCDNIMCDRCILDSTAYICPSCYGELLLAKETWPHSMPARDLRDKIEAFMRTRPGTHGDLVGMALEDEFQRLTGG